MLKWIVTLESGNFKRGQSYLRTKKERFCCMGVLHEVVHPGAWKFSEATRTYFTDNTDGHLNSIWPSPATLKAVGIDYEDGTRYDLAQLNDGKNWSFKRIAKWLRKKYLPEEYHL